MMAAGTGFFKLLAECEALGIEMRVVHTDRLEADGPRSALNEAILARITRFKPELLVWFSNAPLDRRAGAFDLPPCRCGSTRFRCFPIHGGRSVRRDCQKCRRFLDFPVWYGDNT